MYMLDRQNHRQRLISRNQVNLISSQRTSYSSANKLFEHSVLSGPSAVAERRCFYYNMQFSRLCYKPNGIWTGSCLYIFGCLSFIGAFVTGQWALYALAVALSLFVRVPPPLGQLPPLLDATFSAFVSTFLWPGVALSLLLALSTNSCLWLAVSLLLVCRAVFSLKEYEKLKDDIKTLIQPLDKAIADTDTDVDQRHSYDNDRCYSGSDGVSVSGLPFLVRLHPYFLSMYHGSRDDGKNGGVTDIGGGVRIRRIAPDEDSTELLLLSSMPSEQPTLNASIDVWMMEEDLNIMTTTTTTTSSKTSVISNTANKTNKINKKQKKPVFFFVHGGAWLAGSSRRHTQVALLHRLVNEGWIVVAVNYRKTKWPHQLDDTLAAFNYMVHAAQSWVQPSSGTEIDLSRIVLSGVSAGGHLVTLLTSKLMADAEVTKRCNIVATVLFYPAIDPSGEAAPAAGARFLFNIPLLKAKKGQGLMHWFFERAVLRDAQEHWHSAKPISCLHDNPQLAVHWPRCVCVHGSLDSIVPIEQSQAFLRTLHDLSIRAATGATTATTTATSTAVAATTATIIATATGTATTATTTTSTAATTAINTDVRYSDIINNNGTTNSGNSASVTTHTLKVTPSSSTVLAVTSKKKKKTEKGHVKEEEEEDREREREYLLSAHRTTCSTSSSLFDDVTQHSSSRNSSSSGNGEDIGTDTDTVTNIAAAIMADDNTGDKTTNDIIVAVDLNGPYRQGDALITVPGAKHSFEAGGGEVTRIVFDGVALWLRQFNG